MSEWLQTTTAGSCSEITPGGMALSRALPFAGQIVLTTSLAFAGTSSTPPVNPTVEKVGSALQRTNAGFVLETPTAERGCDGNIDRAREPSATLAELRRLSGLTWDQLARLFDVDRRSLHFWASGKPMNARNEERLSRLLSAIRGVDRGSARETRRALLSEVQGRIPFDLLTAGDYDGFVKLVGTGDVAPRHQPAPVSSETRRARAPRPPEELVGALDDRDYINKGKGRRLSSTPIRTGRKR